MAAANIRKHEDTTSLLDSQAGRQIALPLPIDCAPAIVRAHGYRDAHSRPLVMPAKGRASYRVAPQQAWGFRYLELNPANSVSVLTLDVDQAERTLDLLSPFAISRPLPEPSWTVVNRRNGHSHPCWCLATPIHLNRESSLPPQKAMARISEFYRGRIGADDAYAGILVRNPYRGRGGKCYWGRARPYSLDELAEVVPATYRGVPRPVTKIGRNVGLFRALMKWAGSPANKEAPLYPVASGINKEFETPLPAGEVQWVVKSVARYRARWIRDGKYSSNSDSAVQAQRGRASGKARRKRVAERNARIVQAQQDGKTQKAIAAEFNVNQATVSRVLAAGRVPSVEQRKPWVEAGISRSTWYRWKARERTVRK